MLSYLKRHSFIVSAIMAIVVFAAIVGGRAVRQKTAATANSGAKKVTLANVAAFRESNLSVSADGIVESHSQADLKSQISAPVSAIRVSIGENIYAGETIIELQNADIRAQLMQAQALLALAQGQKLTGTVSLDSAKRSLADKIRDAYIKVYDAVATQADAVLFNNNGNGGRLPFSTNANLNSEIIDTDIDLKAGFASWKSAIDALSSESPAKDLEDAVILSQKYLSKADLLLSDMSQVLNGQTYGSTQEYLASLNSWKTTVSGAHAAVSSAAQALTAADAAFSSASSSQGSTAPAQVEAAKASVDNLEAQLAKTVIRSPIAGKVSALPLKVGELASPGTLLATVIGNESGLLIKAYISGEDLPRVAAGASATIQDPSSRDQNASSSSGEVKGTVANVAPGVDQATKKAEVDVDIANPENSGLVVGENVSVAIMPMTAAVGNILDATYLLPIQDIKVIPGASYVLTVDRNSRIKRNNVKVGAIRGDFIEVTAGLTDDMNIVTPVYELDEGQTVVVQ